MPELIRLRTPDFEFSVWANDISQRKKTYQTTVANRTNLKFDASLDKNHRGDTNHSAHLQPSYLLLFSPPTELCDIIEPKGLVADGLKKQSELRLNSPLFFENTQYQFEWVFFSEVSNARLTHTNQSINEVFRFVPEAKTSKGVIPARLTGIINTGNDVGWLRLPLTFEREGKIHTQNLSFEILPIKMVLYQDLHAMNHEIDKTYPLWRFSLAEKTKQDVATGQHRGHFPIMWLAGFAELRAHFEQSLKVICAAPHSRLQPTAANIKAAKLKGNLTHKLAEQVKQDIANGLYDKRYRIEKKKLKVDTAENRFIKMVVEQSKLQLAKFETKLRQSNQAPERQRLSDSFLDELHSWQQPLQKVLTQSFLKDVGTYTDLNKESLVLHQKTGYSRVYRIWQELKFYLDVLGKQSSISMKSVAEIYEVWCFLCLKRMLEQDLGFKLVENSATKLVQNDFFEYKLKDGFAGAFRFKRSDGVMVRLAHEPKFTKIGKSIRSYLVNQEPDIVLEVTIPKNEGPEKEKQFIWLFDAKYRIKTNKNSFDNSADDIAITDYVPDDAINQLHRYRDALIRLSEYSSSSKANQPAKKSRPVFGAFALYPGFFEQSIEQNPYATAINEVGIGAFALLPSQTEQDYSGRQWLLEFLQNQIGMASSVQLKQTSQDIYTESAMVERLYLQDAARIPYYGMRQILYPDLIMAVALSEQLDCNNDYLEGIKKDTARWYYLPQSIFSQSFKKHIAKEIKYLALASHTTLHNSTKQIDKLWPVKQIIVLPRYAITEHYEGKKSSSTELYYLFELGKALMLQTPITDVPYNTMINLVKFTTLNRLQKVTSFSEIEAVYTEAMI
ncbi:DUF2357 domain-containing protein [Providencia sp. wls1943]|uniref:DUF2357 domain-containing protein n=1 Tax=Providencia sp. wls1943 TaxID=2675150 RepID=UPI0012B56C00|nr:DUF2357 domain-containing protein [Providencia sp. wls1943]MTB66392.1 DUF2357 domain-containing protein [Providencia sp. wls1943]